MQPQYRARIRGSARFSPYYKVQWYDAITMAWRDVQHKHPSVVDARAAYLRGTRCRVMGITEQGRNPVPDTDTLSAVR